VNKLEKRAPVYGDIIYTPAFISPSGAVCGDGFQFHDEGDEWPSGEALIAASGWESLQAWSFAVHLPKERVKAQCLAREFVDAGGNWK
jgi:hypothetical protein